MNKPLPPMDIPRAGDALRGRDAPPPRRRAAGALLGLLALMLGLFLLGYLPKQRQRARLLAEAAGAADRLARVRVLHATARTQDRTLTLPATLQGLEEAAVYARADGYVAALHADLGDEVQAGQVLAELDIPEADREIQQARAALASSEAQLLRAQAAREHSELNFARYQTMTPGLVAQQDLDEKRTQASLDRADVAVAVAARDASRANLDRLRQLKAFSKVVAPFTGTVTARLIERGALVRSKDSPLFRLASLHIVRAFAQVPQSRVAGVALGQRVRIAVAEYPGRNFEGQVSHSASALDSASRTMSVEIRIPNPGRTLLPGMFASVTLELNSVVAHLSVPATALIIDEHGTHVASVDDHGRVHLLPVVIERDDGAEVELASGLRGDESLIANPGPAVVEGSRVQVDGQVAAAAATAAPPTSK